MRTGGHFAFLSRGERLAAASGVMATMFLAAMGQTSLAAAMPAIVSDLGDFDRYTWPLTAYLVASTVATPITGRLADIHGRRVFFVAGLAILVAGSAPAGLVTTMAQLTAFRAVQGIGGGIVMTASIVAIADLFSPAERGKAQGAMGAILFPRRGRRSAAGWLAHGPRLVALDLRGQRGGGTAGAARHSADFSRRPGRRRRPEARLSRHGDARAGGDSGHDRRVPGRRAPSLDFAQVGSVLLFGVVMAGVFLVIESRAETPIMPLEIYRHRTVVAAVALSILASFSLYGVVLFTPLFFQSVQGVTATGSGGILAPLGAGVLVGAVVSGQLLSRTGGHYRVQAAAGAFLMTAGSYLLSTMTRETGLDTAAAYLVIAGAGLGSITTTATVAVQNAVPFAVVGVTTSALLFYRLVGSALGMALLGALLATRFGSRFEAALSESVRSAFAPNHLEALKSDPRLFGDPSASDALSGILAAAGPARAEAANELLRGLNDAVAGAVGDAFTLCAAVTALSLAAALFLKVRPGTENTG